MSIRSNIAGENLELVVSDRVDGAAANELEIQVLAAIRKGYKGIYINLSEAVFICSAAIRVLLQYHRQMKANQKVLCVSRTSPEVDSILEMTGFKDLIVEKA